MTRFNVDSPTDGEKLAYKKGFRDALYAFAHWKEGTQYVGTTGKELKDVLAHIESTFNYDERFNH